MVSHAEKPILLKPERVWTAEGRAPETGWAVLVDGARIAEVGPAESITVPPETEIIELPGTTLLPGLMDLHSHLFLYPYNRDKLGRSGAAGKPRPIAPCAPANMRARPCWPGFTTLRDLGTEGANHADAALKRAIEDGIVPGPRLFVATKAIVATGCYGPAVRNFRSDCCVPQGAEEASGVDEIVRAVRQQAAQGADWIKLYGDYRVGPNGETAADLLRRGTPRGNGDRA